MLTLVIGGAFNGKRDFLESKGYTDFSTCLSPLPAVLYKLNQVVYSGLREGGFDPDAVLSAILSAEELVVVCDEVGCGIVPMDKLEGDYREITGRLCCALAQRADVVYRLFAGLESRLKP